MRVDSGRTTLGDSEQDLSMRKLLLEECHTQGGHYGIHDVVMKIHEKGYTWAGIREDIGKFIAQCQTCRKYNLKKGFHPLQSETHVFPMSRVSSDVIGP
jgi:hypothetical protein